MNETTLILTGGLGNQLFQLSAALNQESEKLELVLGLGRLREIDGRAALLSFSLPREISAISIKRSDFWTRLMGFTLRRGIKPRTLEDISLVRFILNTVTNSLFSLLLKKRVRHFAASDVGYVGEIPKERNLLIGYFQSYRYVERTSVVSKLKLLEPSSQSPQLLTLIDRAKRENPIIIHIRLCDYLSEDSFGIPSARYYKEALATLDPKGERHVWVFSDDHDLALREYVSYFDSNCRLVEDHDMNAVQVLEIMRYGKDYIIGNSSFSWWAAFLSHSDSVRVICPEPWFKELPEPKDLIPSNWMRRSALWDS